LSKEAWVVRVRGRRSVIAVITSGYNDDDTGQGRAIYRSP
jgi:hypothetical protein